MKLARAFAVRNLVIIFREARATKTTKTTTVVTSIEMRRTQYKTKKKFMDFKFRGDRDEGGFNFGVRSFICEYSAKYQKYTQLREVLLRLKALDFGDVEGSKLYAYIYLFEMIHIYYNT